MKSWTEEFHFCRKKINISTQCLQCDQKENKLAGVVNYPVVAEFYANKRLMDGRTQFVVSIFTL
jgi:hypothetical protein